MQDNFDLEKEIAWHQQKIETLKNKIAHEEKIRNGVVIAIVILVLLCVACWFFTEAFRGLVVLFGIGIAVLLYLMIRTGNAVPAMKELIGFEEESIRLAQTDIEAYMIRRRALNIQTDVALRNLSEQREDGTPEHPKCPMCFSLNTRRISTANRAVSVAAVGLASSKIGKQYECLDCKHKW